MKDLTAILITFLRPELTKKCVQSLLNNYGGIKIIVGENAEYNSDLHKFLKEREIKYKMFPFDSGICVVRNHLIAETETEYVLIGDDDFLYNEKAAVEKMLKFIKGHREFALIGGRVSERSAVRNYQGFISFFEDHIQYTPLILDGKDYKKDRKSGLRFTRCDLTFNYFVGRKDEIIKYPWDEKIKVGWEHSDWFIGLKHKNVPVAFTPDAVVAHMKEDGSFNKELYQTYRLRLSDKEYFFNKHRIEYIIDMAGRTCKRDIIFNKRKYYVRENIFFEGKQYNAGEIVMTDRPNDKLVPAL